LELDNLEVAAEQRDDLRRADGFRWVASVHLLDRRSGDRALYLAGLRDAAPVCGRQAREHLVDQSNLPIRPLELTRTDELVDEEIAARLQAGPNLLEEVLQRADVVDGRDAEDDVVGTTLERQPVQVPEVILDVAEPQLTCGQLGSLERSFRDVDRLVRASKIVLGEAALELSASAAERQDTVHGAPRRH